MQLFWNHRKKCAGPQKKYPKQTITNEFDAGLYIIWHVMILVCGLLLVKFFAHISAKVFWRSTKSDDLVKQWSCYDAPDPIKKDHGELHKRNFVTGSLSLWSLLDSIYCTDCSAAMINKPSPWKTWVEVLKRHLKLEKYVRNAWRSFKF